MPGTLPALPTTLPDAALLCPELRASPNRIRGKAEKEELPVLVPEISLKPPLGGPNNPGLLGSQTQPSGGSGIRNQDLRLPKHRPSPGKRYQCTGDGCRLACRTMTELLDHMRVHYRPTQSLEGKTFRCSTLGCVELFPDMQSLMSHMKVHYKPNRYFKCENCMSRFRTHRSLFKHLHSCSDPAATRQSPALMAEKPVLLPTSSMEKEPPGKVLEELPKLQSVIQHIKKEATLPGHSSNSRIVWEHTRGRYNCLQCPYSTASREEMTQHTEDHRKNPSPPSRLDGEMDFGVAIPSFHPKLTSPEVENSLFSPL
ncbi:zinc finger protein 414-like isoform X3 [Sceloporus undulatus]|uniref:zinc finger protein 414-like isoform X3 n=1 Tax=Sceloporus undulatus TaxID=8520 RepID=UPI001C4C1693|nr:zinc finger protein 414-like isoform X3 [Sceloporus undulatus]